MAFDTQIWVLFPHQLFASNAGLGSGASCRFYLLEEPLLFTQFRFCRQKLILQRASMRMHADYLRRHGHEVRYLEAEECGDLAGIARSIRSAGSSEFHCFDLVDHWLEDRIQAAADSCALTLQRHATPMFLAHDELATAHFRTGRPSMARFYMSKRRAHGVLMADGRPKGDRWSFDAENRRRLPKGAPIPQVYAPPHNTYVAEARRYVDNKFPNAPGAGDPFVYPVTYEDANAWLADFCRHRLADFGAYEDAISTQHGILYHSVLSPLLNVGLLTPQSVLEHALAYEDRVPINSLEGFVRQILGWREFVKGAYVAIGRRQRSRNFWHHQRAIPAAFYDGTTGIAPVDCVIRRVLQTGYSHHIERLMVLACFMQLCEFHPDEVYRWFMELFVDAFDWVMVPNVYGMGLYADGGAITTKPYICGSNYILKMSDFRRGPWCEIWDSLYWRFIGKHREVLSKNPRLQMSVASWTRMGEAKQKACETTADRFLADLH